MSLTVNCLPIDFDCDGDVDTDTADIEVFTSCASGPAVQHNGAANCVAADLDHDNDIDQSDFGIFQRCYNGSTVSADPHCAD